MNYTGIIIILIVSKTALSYTLKKVNSSHIDTFFALSILALYDVLEKDTVMGFEVGV